MTEATYLIRLRDMFTGPLSRMENKMNSFEGHINRVQGSVNSFGSTLTSIARTTGLLYLANQAKELATEAFTATMEFNNLKEAINFAGGENAVQNMEFLNDTINRLGLDITSTYKGFKTFEGGLMGTSLEGQKGLKVFEAVSEAAAVMKLSGEQTEGAFLALGQMMSKGTVSAEELRGQLGERLPGAFQIAARAMGVTTMKLGEMMKAGEVVSEDFLPKFAAELKRTFGPGVLRAQDQFQANWNRLKNFIFDAKTELVNGFIPTLNDIVKIIPQLDFSQVTNTLKGMMDQVGLVFQQFAGLWELIGVNDGFQALNLFARYIFLATRPLSLLYQGIAQLFMLIKNGWGVLKGFGEALAGLFTFDKEKILSGLDAMTAAFDKLKSEAADTFTSWMEDQKKAANTLWNPNAGLAPLTIKRPGESGASTGGSKPGSAKSKESGIEKVSSGTRTINIRVDKLIENVSFNQSLKDNPAQLKDLITRTILTALNDANLAAG